MLGLADLERGLLRELTPCCRQGHPERWRRRAVAGAGGQGALPSPSLSFLHSPTVTSIHDHRKNHSLD